MDFSQTERIESETIQERFIIIFEGISFRYINNIILFAIKKVSFLAAIKTANTWQRNV